MQVKTFLLTLGVGAAAGALGALMLPKDSEVYQTADKAAKSIKTEAGKAIQSMSGCCCN
jgi:gas vesicle protein